MSAQTDSGDQPRFADRVLTDAVRCAEAGRGTTFDDRVILQEIGPLMENADDESYLVARAQRLPVAIDLDRALRRQSRLAWAALTVFMLLTVLFGAGTGRAVLGVERAEPVNIFWLLGGVLGGQLVLLAAWIIIAVIGSRALASASIGGLLVNVIGWIAHRVSRERTASAAIEATLLATTTGAVGRWGLSAIVHAAWSAFNLGLIVMLILLLSARQYNFAWESTILTAQGYERITAAVAHWPSLLGFETPDRTLIAQAQFDPTDPATFPAQDATARAAWSGLLVGAVVGYGLLPRLVLLAGCGLLARRAVNRYRLPLKHPAYVRILSRRPHRHERTINPEVQPAAIQSARRTTDMAQRPPGRPAIVGIELHPPATGWPPPLSNIDWHDLGIIEDRPEQHRLLERLAHDEHEPAPLVIVCDLTLTPDRGMARLLADVRASITTAPLVLLTAGDALRRRSDSTEALGQRIAQWNTIAQQAGIEPHRILELDLDHLTSASLARLQRAVLHGQDAAALNDHPESCLRRALACIHQRAKKWPSTGVAPDEFERLMREMATLYREGGRLKSWLQSLAPEGMPSLQRVEDVQDMMAGAGKRLQTWLPPDWRASSRWALAGALTGVVGCVSAAALLSPVVIGALPMWSLIGGAIGAISQLQLPRSSITDSAAGSERTINRSDAIRSAGLYAIILELQPRDQVVINRILERISHHLPDLADAPDGEAIRRWLDELAISFQSALRAEEVGA